ncbi:hypothetical protein [Actinomadura macrotermitis]|uniref:Uncharacterized protein n=1 Tax=Actinomadura macrotermitis TaxID=2585200 RepID=A0A7K0C748_9ACTN|nr:hypothetical protein [Actinomadura macrotermitis]MQY09299.1 hypothetical protein [Actinomadura macrotermitis]
MSFFRRIGETRLYEGPPEPDPRHRWLGYLLPEAAPPVQGLDLDEALHRAAGSFVFATAAPDLASDAAVHRLVEGVGGLVGGTRAIVWLPDPAAIPGAPNVVMGIDRAGGAVAAGGADVPLVRGLKLDVLGGAALDLAGEALRVRGSGAISFAGPAAPAAHQVSLAELPFTGPARGCLVFTAYLQRLSLHDAWGWGFQFAVPAAGSVSPVSALWLPLASGSRPSGADLIGFTAAVDPADPVNAVLPARTALAFTGENFDGGPTVLESSFRTDTGAKIRLAPVPGPLTAHPDAGHLVFNPGVAGTAERFRPFQAAPGGAYTLQVPQRESAAHRLLCGLGGTEHIAFRHGDRLVFTPRSPAYVPGYPFPEASPVGPPADPAAPLMDDAYRTSWASLVPAGEGGTTRYVAQPRGASLYGRDTLTYPAFHTLFGNVETGVTLHRDTVFPLAPYAGAHTQANGGEWSRDRIEEVERTAIAPTRRKRIGEQPVPPDGPPGPGPAPGTVVTTPAGQLVTVGEDGRWSRILLGQNNDPAPRRMCFCHPGPELQQAFQSSELFLVAANATRLGRLTGAGDGGCTGGAEFQNAMNIGEWEFAADVGRNRYDDYGNVLIVKGREGPLYRPGPDGGDGLVCNPERWTQRADFAAPSDLVPGAGPPPDERVGPPDPAELVVLSGWLQRYFAAAAERTEPHFARFNALARDAAWTGVLVLRMRIADLPADLAGVVAGVADPDRLHAHHFGIEVTQIRNDPDAPVIEPAGDSSMFGLIDYADPAFVPPAPGATPRPVPPLQGADHDFRLLSLRAVFAGTAVQEFESWAQLTVGRLFGMRVAGMGEGGNPFNTIVLRGHYQNDGSRPVHSLTGAAPATFLFPPGAAVDKVEITGVRMSTRDPGDAAAGRDVVSWFDLSGHLALKALRQGDGEPFDVLSFGGEGTAGPRQGLAFAGLGVRMAFPPADPARRAFASELGEVRFDLDTSTPRRDSLFRDYALNLRALVHGGPDSQPEAAGYLPVVTGAPLTGVAGGPWCGLVYELDLGTPGQLAGEVGLVARLLTAWSTGDDAAGDTASQRVMVGLGLPGTKGGATLFSLENVLKVSVGRIRLDRAVSSGTPPRKGFLLTMDDIALRFLGLVGIPPGGSSSFFLFGDQDTAGPGGLGWYALYRRKKAAAGPAPVRPPIMESEQDR